MSLSYFRIANAIIIKPIFSSRLHATPKKPLIFNLRSFCELFLWHRTHTAAQNDGKSLDKKLGQEGKIWVSDIRIYFSANPKMTWHSKRFKLLLFFFKRVESSGSPIDHALMHKY